LPSSKRWSSSEPSLILFDGVCNLCSGVVRFVIARDPDSRFRFAPLQSDAAAVRLQPFAGVMANLDSIALVEGDRLFTRSAAALRIARGLRYPWPLAYVFIAVPGPLRDGVYDFIARRRYRWYGRRETCWMPTPELRARFLAVDTPKPGQLR
jgi:predicted DCC family thiol-disulfide oxidoreductase YuxK